MRAGKGKRPGIRAGAHVASSGARRCASERRDVVSKKKGKFTTEFKARVSLDFFIIH